MKYYKYWFYKIYIGLKKLPFSEYDAVDWGAAIILTVVFSINFLSLMTVYPILTGKLLYYPNQFETNLFIIIIFVGHYFTFIYKKKYIDIIEHFKNEGAEKSPKRKIGGLVYDLGSVLIFLLLNIIKLIFWGY